ncbi:MAG TPA: DUF1611 domain-containing protein [Myxococcota bacterium]
MNPFPVDAERIQRASRAFVARRVHPAAMLGLTADASPRAGDLLLARVQRVGHHGRLHLPTGGRRNLFEGDEIVVAYGARYAPRQFEAVVPTRLEPCHLVAGGGIAARAVSWHARIRRGPTAIAPLGLVTDASGRPINLADWALPVAPDLGAERPRTIAVLGSSMDAGKSTAAAHLVRGLLRLGLRPGYAKLTGTGAGGDVWLAEDAGARPALDFTDAGFASTYQVPPREIERIARTLMAGLAGARVDVAVLEVADGLLQPETAALVRADWFARMIDGALFAAGDAMAALAGVQLLRALRLPVLACTGRLTSSPLEEREAAQATELPVLSPREIADPVTAQKLVDHAHG